MKLSCRWLVGLGIASFGGFGTFFQKQCQSSSDDDRQAFFDKQSLPKGRTSYSFALIRQTYCNVFDSIMSWFSYASYLKVCRDFLRLQPNCFYYELAVSSYLLNFGFMFRNSALFANAAGMIQEEVQQVASVSIELRQTSKFHSTYIVYLYLILIQLFIYSIGEDSR